MKRLPFYIDCGFCLSLALMLYILFPIGRWMDDALLSGTLFLSFFFVSYFVCRTWVVPFFLCSGRRLASVVIFAACVSVMVALTTWRVGWPFWQLSSFYNDRGKVEMSQQRAWLLFFVVENFGIAVSILVELGRQRLRKQEAEIERNRAELALYRAQLNPHFLYNSLNSLYGLVVTRSEKAEQAFASFIEWARGMAKIVQRERVTVAEEIDYMQHYIALQRLRLSAQTEIVFECENHSPCAEVAPMLLIPFVGNALKHGTDPVLPSDIRISLHVSDGRLSFHVSNPVFRSVYKPECGTGLLNCRRRLEMLYPRRHTLAVGVSDGRFEVDLQLIL